jgi:hypothetical protein
MNGSPGCLEIKAAVAGADLRWVYKNLRST